MQHCEAAKCRTWSGEHASLHPAPTAHRIHFFSQSDVPANAQPSSTLGVLMSDEATMGRFALVIRPCHRVEDPQTVGTANVKPMEQPKQLEFPFPFKVSTDNFFPTFSGPHGGGRKVQARYFHPETHPETRTSRIESARCAGP